MLFDIKYFIFSGQYIYKAYRSVQIHTDNKMTLNEYSCVSKYNVIAEISTLNWNKSTMTWMDSIFVKAHSERDRTQSLRWVKILEVLV